MIRERKGAVAPRSGKISKIVCSNCMSQKKQETRYRSTR